MVRRLCVLTLAGAVLSGCRPAPKTSGVAPTPPTRTTLVAQTRPLKFTEITQAAGIRFTHQNGAFGRKWFPETNGSGAAIFDYDGDGWPDLFLVNSREWTASERHAAHTIPPAKPPKPSPSRLYRNRGDGTFEDVTNRAGLDLPMYGMGCAVADYDNDGDLDLYITGVGPGWLFRNEGNGQFTEVAKQAGVAGSGWSTSSAWVDIDRDGLLDLFVCHYVDWQANEDRPCSGANERPVYCGPNLYPPEPCRLYRQVTKGVFKDISQAAGIWSSGKRRFTSKALGVAICDIDRDGWPDLVIANDTEANFLFRNRRNRTFAEEGAQLGVALPEDGLAKSGMGIDTGDWDGSGREGVLVGNFAYEGLSLFRATADGALENAAPKTGVAHASEPFTTFGCLLSDLNNDGWLDIVAANGHIDERMENGNAIPLRQSPLFLLSQAGKSFRQEPLYPEKLIGRGLAAGDLDRDGDVDLILTNNGGSPVLLRNDGREGGSLRLTLEGTRSNRNGLGALITAKVAERKLIRRARSGSSYLSASELPITLGLGQAASAQLTVTWPNGRVEQLGTLEAGQEYHLREGSGVFSKTPLAESAVSGRGHASRRL